MQPKETVMELVSYAQSVQRAFMDGLSDAERAEAGTWEKWTAKDNVAHMNYYLNHLIERVETSWRGEAVAPDSDLEQTNRSIYDAHQNDTWEQVRAASESSFARAIALIQSLDDEQLMQKAPYSWLRRTLADEFIDQTLGHPAEHFTIYAVQRGDTEKALALGTQISKQLQQAAAITASGNAIYNLACIYARADMPEEALQMLPSAFRMQPGLKDWATQDPDLASLQELAAFQSLVN